MLALRKITLPLLFIGGSAWAAAGVFRSTTDISTSQGSASSLEQISDSRAQGFNQNFEIISPTLARQWTLMASAKLNRQDESKLIVKSSAGQDLALDRDQNQTTQNLTLGATYSQGPSQTTIKAGQSLDQSVFQSRQFVAETTWNMNSMSTALGIQFSRNESDLPLNYYFDNFFADSSLKWQARPTRLTRNRWMTSVDQLWSENYKTRSEIFYQQRSQDRPQSIGLAFKNGYSLNTRQIFRADFGTAAEDRRQPLQDERGYFQMNWFELAWNQALTYDLWLTTSYGYLQEVESEPRLSRQTQTGSDVFGLKARYSGRGWTASLKWEGVDSNTEYRSQQFEGALEWEI